MTAPSPKDRLLDALAAVLLADGLHDATLRPLAAKVGTSDRMLIHHFGSKDRLLREVLEHLSDRLARALDAFPLPVSEGDAGSGPMSDATLALAIVDAMRDPGFAGFHRLWLELAAGAAQGLQPHRDIAPRLAGRLHVWLAGRLAGGGEPDDAQRDRAAVLFAVIEGLELLRAVGFDRAVDAARRRWT
jgi:AcrR family transcriptional regulator